MRTLNFPQELINGLAGFYLPDYKSPDHEISLYKGIPIEFRYHPVILAVMAGENEFGQKLRPRYRAVSKPGYSRPQSHVAVKDADTFALYALPNDYY